MRNCTLFLAILAVLAFPVMGSAETITGVTFTGNSANPTITIAGSGFGLEPVGDDSPGGGAFGQDFGADPTTFSLNDNGLFFFQAGVDGDTIGLTNISYTDTLISYQLGENYSTFFDIQYALLQGDPFDVFVKGAEFIGTVSYVPEPSSLALLGTGMLGVAGAAMRRRRLA